MPFSKMPLPKMSLSKMPFSKMPFSDMPSQQQQRLSYSARSSMLLTLLVTSALTVSLATAQSNDQQDIALPERGRSAVTLFALLGHQQSICDGIAADVIPLWQSRGDEAIADVQEYVVSAKLSDLATSRRVADIVDYLTARMRQETPAETESSLLRLSDLASDLCDTVALPSGSLDSFRANLERLLRRSEREQVELGRLLVADQAALDAALEPYLTSIQFAGVEAEGEYLEYLESLRPEPVGPTAQEIVKAWYDTTYAPAVAETKTALSGYLEARRQRNPRSVGTACRTLTTTVGPLLRHHADVFKAPDLRLQEPLNEAFQEMRELAQACARGRSSEVNEHFSKMQEQLADAAAILAEYGLTP